ncbi:MAG: S8 family serine peptidase, partial [Emcibacter sp.]|nr:S8 family serine peptidase [Emcibacter sp.]
ATGIRIGLIDTMLDTSHSALINQAITIEDFVPYDKERPKYHGTAIAAILVGHDPDKYKGIAVGAKLYAASVFFKYDKTKVAATTESLILALDWLVRQKTSVINMSLSGPADPLLEIAINKVMEKGSIIVAAVGNGGPAAAPLYPAAYPGVVAVTAVDKQQHVYLQANRGRHVAFSAPGVNIPTANAGGGYQIRSGTSIAAPFVSAILAELSPENGTVNIVKLLEKNTIDLGKKGFDSTYGYGLIQAVSTQVSALK